MGTLAELRTEDDRLREELAGLRAELALLRDREAHAAAFEARLAMLAHQTAEVPYRHDVGDAGELETTAAALHDAKEREAQLREREELLMRQAESIRRDVEAKGIRRALPFLAAVQIAAPCPAKWSEMHGDHRVRHCDACHQNVYNLSAMTTEEAEALLAGTKGERCIRLYRRADGTVLTNNCPVGLRRARARTLAIGFATVGLLAAAGTAVFMARVHDCKVERTATAGAMMRFE
jgi:hypothetical protein